MKKRKQSSRKRDRQSRASRNLLNNSFQIGKKAMILMRVRLMKMMKMMRMTQPSMMREMMKAMMKGNILMKKIIRKRKRKVTEKIKMKMS